MEISETKLTHQNNNTVQSIGARRWHGILSQDWSLTN